jgi:putative phosphoesterase
MKRLKEKKNYLIGVISDTHGTLSSTVMKLFKNVDLIIHAGDIDSADVLEKLKSIAPTVAVRGNMDCGPWTVNLKQTETIRIGEVVLFVCHNLDGRRMIPSSTDVNAAICGHTHRGSIENKEGILFLNPGSASQRRHGNPLSVALLHIRGKDLHAQIFNLEESLEIHTDQD